MNREEIIEKTMREFKDGKLYSSSGDLVTKRDQAIAIALSKANSKKFGEGGSLEKQNYEMVYSDNKAIIHHAEELKMILNKNKSIPTWAVTLIAKAEQNLSDVTHYLDGKIKYEYGGMLPEILQKVYGEKLEFVDRHAQYQVGIINNLYPDHAEVIIDDKFFDVPNWRITRIITKDLELNKSLIKEIQDTYMLKQSADSSDSFALETMKDGGKVMIASLGAYLLAGETAKKVAPESVSAIDKKLAGQINPEPKPSIWEDRGLKYSDGGPVNYKRPAYDLKTTGVYLFRTNKGNFTLVSYAFERSNDTEDSLEIQEELKGLLGSVDIKNLAWKRLASGKSVKAKSTKGNYLGTLTRIDDIDNALKYNGDKMAKGGPVKSYPDLSLMKPDVVNDTNMVPEFELKQPNKITQLDTLRRKIVGNSRNAMEICREIWEKDTIGGFEQAYVLFFNNNNEIIGYYHHSSGGIAGTIMDVEMISAMAVKSLSRGVIIAHNHPSGNNRPSDADLRISKQLKDALALFNIPLMDSLIITTNSYYSLKDNGDL
jgi:DNA repair protein RadC